jgi:CheY-like chemotaxis protein
MRAPGSHTPYKLNVAGAQESIPFKTPPLATSFYKDFNSMSQFRDVMKGFSVGDLSLQCPEEPFRNTVGFGRGVKNDHPAELDVHRHSRGGWNPGKPLKSRIPEVRTETKNLLLKRKFTLLLIAASDCHLNVGRQRSAMARQFKVLLVDDEPDILGLLGFAFRSRGYDVTLASDGKSALEILSSREFDLVVTDLHMGPIDGFVVLKSAKKLNPSTIVYVMTGDPNPDLVSKSLRLGADDFLFKPFSFTGLLQRVAGLHSKSRLTA